MRVGEALGLRHEDIDAAGTVIRIRKRHNSNGALVEGRQREIPVPPGLIRLYTDYLVVLELRGAGGRTATWASRSAAPRPTGSRRPPRTAAVC